MNSRRAQQVRELVMTGIGYREMADVLGLSPRTVRVYIERILELEGVSSMRELQGREIERLRSMVGEAV